MSQNHKQTVRASVLTVPSTVTQVMSNNDASGMILVVDATTVVATGTLTPSITITGDADTTSATLWTAAAAIAAAGIKVYYFYPQGVDTVAGALTGVTERLSVSIPNKFTVSFLVQTANVTFSATIYWLV